MKQWRHRHTLTPTEALAKTATPAWTRFRANPPRLPRPPPPNLILRSLMELISGWFQCLIIGSVREWHHDNNNDSESLVIRSWLFVIRRLQCCGSSKVQKWSFFTNKNKVLSHLMKQFKFLNNFFDNLCFAGSLAWKLLCFCLLHFLTKGKINLGKSDQSMP